MISISDARSALGAGPEHDAAIDRVRTAAIDLLEREAGRPLAQRAGYVETRFLGPREPRYVRLSLVPVSVVTTFEERDVGESWAALDVATDLIVDLATGRIDRASASSSLCFKRHVRVTYDGGWSTAATPPDVREALLTQVKFMWRRFRLDVVDVRGVQTKGGGATFMERAELHPFFRQIARSLRR